MKNLLIFILIVSSLVLKSQNIEAELFNGGAYGSDVSSDLVVTLKATAQYSIGSASSPTIFVFRIEQAEWDLSGVTSVSILDNPLDMGDVGTPDAEWDDPSGFHYIYFSAGIADWDLNSCSLVLGNSSTYLSIKFNDMSNSFVVEMTLKDVDPVVGSEVNLVDENQLIITNGIVMPLDLIDFKISSYKKYSSFIKWETTNEVNVDEYEIQRSKDLKTWQNIGLVKAKNIKHTTNYYSYIDKDVYDGFGEKVFSYRLMMIDEDGQFEYSNVENIRFSSDKSKLDIAVFPNPSSEMIYFKLDGIKRDSKLEILVFDSNGKLVFKRNERYNLYENILLNNNHEKLDNGLYNLIISDENSIKYYSSFILSR